MSKLSLARTSLALLGLALLFPLGAATPAQAVTCEEVRAMTPAEVDLWAKRLKVSSKHLSALLNQAFCDGPRAQQVIASTRKPEADKAR
jgi:hypothetical protein